MDGFLEEKKTLSKHAPFIREYFKPIEHHQKNINILISDIREKYDLIVGVHLRKGDYKTWMNGKYYYSDDTYLSFINSMKNILKDKSIAFLLCSNEEIDLNHFNDKDIFTGTGHLVEDLYSFSECDYLIGPPSTYTMWASFYGKTPLRLIKDPDEEISLESFSVL